MTHKEEWSLLTCLCMRTCPKGERDKVYSLIVWVWLPAQSHMDEKKYMLISACVNKINVWFKLLMGKLKKTWLSECVCAGKRVRLVIKITSWLYWQGRQNERISSPPNDGSNRHHLSSSLQLSFLSFCPFLPEFFRIIAPWLLMQSRAELWQDYCY